MSLINHYSYYPFVIVCYEVHHAIDELCEHIKITNLFYINLSIRHVIFKKKLILLISPFQVCKRFGDIGFNSIIGGRNGSENFSGSGDSNSYKQMSREIW